MKIKLKCDGGPVLQLKYENDEYKVIETILKGLGLEKAETDNMWGSGTQAKYYRETSSQLQGCLSNMLGNGAGYFSNINKPIYLDRCLNLAIFRAVPDNSGVVSCTLDKFLTVQEVNTIIDKIKHIYTIIYNVVVDAEITIKTPSIPD